MDTQLVKLVTILMRLQDPLPVQLPELTVNQLQI